MVKINSFLITSNYNWRALRFGLLNIKKSLFYSPISTIAAYFIFFTKELTYFFFKPNTSVSSINIGLIRAQRT